MNACILGRMRKRSDIHTFEDEAFIKRISIMSAWAFLAGVLATLLLAAALAACAPQRLDAWLTGLFADDGEGFVGFLKWFGWTAVAVVLSLVVHELVHGALFKAFAPRGARVTFGANWEKGMLYASAEGIVYSRGHYMAVALAPTFLVTSLVVAAGFACGCPVAGAFAATLHLSGCTGDWGYVREMLRDPGIRWCEDTAWGVCFYGEGDAEDAAGKGDAGLPDGAEGLDDGCAPAPAKGREDASQAPASDECMESEVRP